MPIWFPIAGAVARCPKRCRATSSPMPPLAPAPRVAACCGRWAKTSPGYWTTCRDRSGHPPRRPKLSCRTCETIAQAPAPSLPVRRGRAGLGLLAHVLVAKYCDHLPLHRQAEIYARE